MYEVWNCKWKKIQKKPTKAPLKWMDLTYLCTSTFVGITTEIQYVYKANKCYYAVQKVIKQTKPGVDVHKNAEQQN